MHYDEAAAALLVAVKPVATYCERTPRPHRHAEALDALLVAVADFGEAAEALAGAPPWERAALLLLDRLPTQRFRTPLADRIQRHLSQPHMRERLLLPDAQRRELGRVTSHHLPPPSAYVPF